MPMSATNNGSVQVSQIHGALTVNDRFGSVNRRQHYPDSFDQQ